MPQQLVSLIVLSYNRPGMLRKCLEGVTGQSYTPLEVIVVDNRSSASEEIRSIVAAHPRFRLIANDENLGFTGGMNTGIQAATGHYVCLTEDDIILHENYVARLVEFHEQRPEAGMLSGLQLNYHAGTVRCRGGSFQLDGVFKFTIAGSGQPFVADETQPFATEFVPGSMIFARTALLRQLGGFRPEFFMYFEDLELCARIRRKDLPIYLVPAAMAWHVEPEGNGSGTSLQYHRLKNFVTVYLLHARWSVLPEFFVRYGLLAWCRALLGDWSQLKALTRAWLWNLWNLPRLLSDRRGLGRAGL